MSRNKSALSLWPLLLFGALSLEAQDLVERRPPRALQAFREARRQIVSGRIDWTVTLPDQARTMHFVSRYAANGDLIFENRGDDDGWTEFYHTHGTSKFPHLYLARPEGVWLYKETMPHATLWPPGSPSTSGKPRLKDARAIGIFSTSKSIETPLASRGAWESETDPVVSYEERREGDLVIVTGHHRSGSVTEWTLAPQMGWNALTIVSESPDGTQTSVENELEKFGRFWLPKRATYRRNGQVEAVVCIERTRLNQPDDPRSFTPNDIGMECGIHVAVQTDPLGTFVKFWNGEEISEADRYRREVRLGLRTPGKVIRQISEKGYFDSPYLVSGQRRAGELAAAKFVMQRGVRAYQTLWRAYVESFIKRYRLDEDQRQKAHAILAECERVAEPIAEKLESRWSEIHKQLDQAVRERDAERATELRKQWQELQKPLEAIFEKRLKPGLEKLPTRAQRRAAEAKQE